VGEYVQVCQQGVPVGRASMSTRLTFDVRLNAPVVGAVRGEGTNI
jgi:hypothetical protein